MNFLTMMKYPSISLLIAAATLASARPARACGGTFCDGGPSTVPVTQSGENILFVMDSDHVEAHIQIQYTGKAHDFAWVIPVAAVPELSVGSQALFANLLAGSVPTYSFQATSSCATPVLDSGGGFGCGASGVAEEDDFGGGTGGGSASHEGTAGPTVVAEETVGAFDVTILQGGTAKEVTAWLQANGYASSSATPKLLSSYVEKSYVFLAVKLAGANGVNEIQPLVVKYPGTMPCIPLVLTAEAAVDNMGVRAFFLGSHRFFSENFADVVLNDARIDWQRLATNYDAVVAHAVDEAPHGLGFVTEYAGPSSVVQTTGLFSESWNAEVFKTIEPQDVVTELESQGLASCFQRQCSFSNPLLPGLLGQYLPAPAGSDPSAWYATLQRHPKQIDMTAWDPQGFARDFEERVVKPGSHALAVVSTHPYLTRLFTRISPAEMKLDPTFNARPDLSDQTVSAFHTATSTTTCSGRTAMTMPDGSNKVTLTSAQRWPNLGEMPFAAEIRTVPAKGAPVVVVDNRAVIAAELAERLEMSGFAAAVASDALQSNQPAASNGCGIRGPGHGAPRGVLVLGAGALALALRRVLRKRR